MAYGILVIEDEQTLANNIKRYLEGHDYEVRIASTAEEGMKQFEASKPDAVLLDLRLPGMDGLETLSKMREIDAQAKIILITGHGNVENAVEAMKAGAYDFLSKPLVLAKLRMLLDKAVGQTRMEGTLSYYREKAVGINPSSLFIGESSPMRSLKEQISKVVHSDHLLSDVDPPAVLITGETGTGKELVARALHYNGPRKEEPFVEINCASLPNTLLESELFGYERGAFTDAKTKKIGLFEAANKGTLFLDEIGDMDMALQAKLLKVLEDKMVRPLGSLREHRISARIIAATNQSLEEQIHQGKFRSDLFFRLSIIHLSLPPLRARGQDILLIARHFLEVLGSRYRKSTMSFSSDAEHLLLSYSWPGNVRELKNIVEQTVILSNHTVIHAEQLPLNTRLAGLTAGTPLHAGLLLQKDLPPEGVSLEMIERDLVLKALQQTSWNITRAAKLLRLSRDTLRYRLEKYKITPPA